MERVNERSGTQVGHSGFIGELAEITVDTNKKTVVVHDGVSVGGTPIAREDLSNVSVIPTGVVNQLIGYTGSKGAIGQTGYTGSVGATGQTGTIGQLGYTGSTGALGEQGGAGENGMVGIVGQTGYTGSQGTQGNTGAIGLQGDAHVGFVGSKGYTGSTGYQGSLGLRGVSGAPGITGQIGYIGSSGDESVGSIGLTGVMGSAGYTGSQGQVGDRGYTGSRGITGTRGQTGPSGTPGIDGLRGAPSSLIGGDKLVPALGAVGTSFFGFNIEAKNIEFNKTIVDNTKFRVGIVPNCKAPYSHGAVADLIATPNGYNCFKYEVPAYLKDANNNLVVDEDGNTISARETALNNLFFTNYNNDVNELHWKDDKSDFEDIISAKAYIIDDALFATNNENEIVYKGIITNNNVYIQNSLADSKNIISSNSLKLSDTLMVSFELTGMYLSIIKEDNIVEVKPKINYPDSTVLSGPMCTRDGKVHVVTGNIVRTLSFNLAANTVTILNTLPVDSVHAAGGIFSTSVGVYLVGGNNSNKVTFVATDQYGVIDTVNVIGNLPSNRKDAIVINEGKTVYLLGGTYNGMSTQIVYKASILEDNTIGSWSAAYSLPSSKIISKCVIKNNICYLLCNDTDRTVFIASVDDYGILSKWIKQLIVPELYGATYTKKLNGGLLVGGMSNGEISNTTYITKNDNKLIKSGFSLSEQLPNGMVVPNVINTDKKIYVYGGITGITDPDNTLFKLTDKYLSDYSRQNILKTSTLTDLTGWSAGTQIGTKSHLQTAVIGNRVYMFGGYRPSTALSEVFYATIAADGTIGSWVAGTNLPYNVYGAQVLVTKTRVYLIGGHNGSAALSNVYYATINSDNSLGTWTAGTALPAGRYYAALAVIKNNVYLYSGATDSSIVMTSINTDGSIGSWASVGNTPDQISFGHTLVTDKYLYLIGGITGSTGRATVYRLNIGLTGIEGGWSTMASLPDDVYGGELVATKNSVFLLGGQGTTTVTNISYSNYVDDVTFSFQTSYVLNGNVYLFGPYPGETNANNITSDRGTVFQTTINADGTINTFSRSDYSLPVSISNPAVFYYNKRFFVLGGGNKTLMYADVFDNYRIGSWVSTTSLPDNISNTTTLVHNNKVYLIGGIGNGVEVAMVRVASFGTDGLPSAWNETTPLPVAIGDTQAFILDNTLFVAREIYGNGITNNVYKTTINPDGTLGAWTIGFTLEHVNRVRLTLVQQGRTVHIISGGKSYSKAVFPTGSLTPTLSTISNTSTSVWSDTYNTYILTGPRIYSIAPVTVTQSGFGTDGGQYSYLVNDYNNSMIRYITKGNFISAPIDTNNGEWTISTNSTTTYHAALYNFTRRATSTNVVQSTRSGVYYAKINKDGTLGSWASITSMPGAKVYGKAFVTKSNLYYVGGDALADNKSSVYSVPFADGWDSSHLNSFFTKKRLTTKFYQNLLENKNITKTNEIYSANVDEYGMLDMFVNDGTLPVELAGCVSVVVKNKLYIMGGVGNELSDKIYTAIINTDGSISPVIYYGKLPFPMIDIKTVVTKNKVYIVGWYNINIPINKLGFVCDISDTGELSEWVITTAPEYTELTTVLAKKHHVYSIGGYDSGTLKTNVLTTSFTDGWSLTNNESMISSSTGLGEFINSLTTQNQTVPSTVETINDWVSTQQLPGNIHSFASIVVKGRVYTFGGRSSTGAVTSVYSTTIATDGTIGEWGLYGNIPVAISNMEAIVTKDCVYLIGGLSSIAESSIYKASIDSSGLIGTWSNVGNLPDYLYDYSSVVTKNKIYLIGGKKGRTTEFVDATDYDKYVSYVGYVGRTTITVAHDSSNVYVGSIDSNGNIGTWDVTTNLPTTKTKANTIVNNNTVYVIGGSKTTYLRNPKPKGTNLTWSTYVTLSSVETEATIYKAIIDSNGTLGVFSLYEKSLPFPIDGNKLVMTKNKVYSIAGITTENTCKILTAEIDDSGILGDFVPTFDFPVNLKNHGVFVTKGHMYTIGGENSTGIKSSVYIATFNGGWEITSNSNMSDYFNSIIYKYLNMQNTQNINLISTVSDISNWSNGSTLLKGIINTQILVTKQYVYLFGGFDGKVEINTIYRAPLNTTDGTIGTWVVYGALTAGLQFAQCVFLRNKVYLIGGYSNNMVSTFIYKADINTDGNLGTFTKVGDLSLGIAKSVHLKTKSRLYLFGGHNGEYPVSDVLYSTINNDGTLGTWKNDTSLPIPMCNSKCFIGKEKIYVVGGENGDGELTKVYSTNIQNDGSITTWTEELSLPKPVSNGNIIVSSNRVYIYSYIGYGFKADISVEGTLGTWTEITPLPEIIAGGSMIVTKGKLHLIGGKVAIKNETGLKTVYKSDILEDGTLGQWERMNDVLHPVLSGSGLQLGNRVYLDSGVNQTYDTSVSSIVDEKDITELPGSDVIPTTMQNMFTSSYTNNHKGDSQQSTQAKVINTLPVNTYSEEIIIDPETEEEKLVMYFTPSIFMRIE